MAKYPLHLHGPIDHDALTAAVAAKRKLPSALRERVRVACSWFTDDNRVKLPAQVIRIDSLEAAWLLDAVRSELKRRVRKNHLSWRAVRRLRDRIDNAALTLLES
jgi:ABC-type transporter Mla MlaB component